ncbi:MAG: hypothetical protein ACLVB5_05725 [Christensenellales bacterium]
MVVLQILAAMGLDYASIGETAWGRFRETRINDSAATTRASGIIAPVHDALVNHFGRHRSGLSVLTRWWRSGSGHHVAGLLTAVSGLLAVPGMYRQSPARHIIAIAVGISCSGAQLGECTGVLVAHFRHAAAHRSRWA